MKKIGFISLGCPKNQIDGECMLASLCAQGYELADPYEGVDAVIINTCGFIESAKMEAIENILAMAELKKEGLVGKIIVTGCLAERYKDEIVKEIPEADAVVGIGAERDIVRICNETVDEGRQVLEFPPKSCLDFGRDRLLTTPGYYAYIKIAEGCSNRCTYCAIPDIRGPYRSRDMDDIVDEARALAEKGVREIILVAQDTTLYGRDLYGCLALPALLKRLAEIDGIAWIRLLYCYPDKFTDELIECMQKEEKVLNYVDLPLQHASDGVLKRMNRHSTADNSERLIKKLREKIPDICIRTTFITGFPGETEKEFEELLSFVERTEFERMGCFAYSPEEGTPAAEFEDQTDEQVKEDRKDRLMMKQYDIVESLQSRLVGKTLTVLTEGYDEETDSYFGRSYMDAPEIDGIVRFKCENEPSEGDFVAVRIIGWDEYDLLGEAD